MEKFVFGFLLVSAVIISIFLFAGSGRHVEIENHEKKAVITEVKPAKAPEPSFKASSHVPQNLKPQVFDIDTAYKLTNVKRTSFTTNPLISAEENRFLKELFDTTDIIVRERIALQVEAQQTNRIKDFSNYDYAITRLQMMSVPDSSELIRVHDLITHAAIGQKAYFEQMNRTGEYFNANSTFVQQSHNHLLEAYGILIKKYPKDTVNERAFYSHLCAMDFI